jgi:hypothetical protein
VFLCSDDAQGKDLGRCNELRQLLRIGPRGTPARNVTHVASLGFEVEVKSSNVAELAAALLARTPPIVYVDTGSLEFWSVDCAHVAVLVGMELGAISLNDPAFDSAPLKASLAAFPQAWAPNEYLAAFIRPHP